MPETLENVRKILFSALIYINFYFLNCIFFIDFFFSVDSGMLICDFFFKTDFTVLIVFRPEDGLNIQNILLKIK